MVNRVINEWKTNLGTNVHREKTDGYYKFPYIQGLSNQIQRNINKNKPGCKLAFYNLQTVSKLYSKLKDPQPKELRCNLIYKIPCSNCEKCYVGTTKQYLKKRIYQHSYDCREYNREKIDKTALAQHHFETGHNFNFNLNDIDILDVENNYFKRCLSEMIFISLNKTVNSRMDVQGLNTQYNNLLHLHSSANT